MPPSFFNIPKTQAARKAMAAHGKDMASDLIFLEHWENTSSQPTTSSLLRALQIKKANPKLMQAISNELRMNYPIKHANKNTD